MLAYWILRTLDNTVKIQEIVFNLVLRYSNSKLDMFCSPQNHFEIRITTKTIQSKLYQGTSYH